MKEPVGYGGAGFKAPTYRDITAELFGAIAADTTVKHHGIDAEFHAAIADVLESVFAVAPDLVAGAIREKMREYK